MRKQNHPPFLMRCYKILFPLCVPLLLLRLLWRSRKNPAYRQRWSERLGHVPFPNPQKPIIWIHAVSLGESIAITPLIRHCLNSFPDHAILVTNTTITGSAQIQGTFGKQVLHSYLPYDSPKILYRFFQGLRNPVHLLVVAETELWPLLFGFCGKRNIPIMIVNARISDYSFPKYCQIIPITRWTLRFVDQVLAQSQQDGERFLRLGLTSDRLQVVGNVKFDAQLKAYSPEVLEAIQQRLNPQNQYLLWVAASTHAVEEEMLLDAFEQAKQCLPHLRLLLAPRHPERFDKVSDLIKSRGFSLIRHQSKMAPPSNTEVYLIDTMGELSLFFQISHIAFVGGSLVPIGGHNPIEPTMAGLPVIMGPYTQNCQDVVKLLGEAEILKKISGTAELKQTLIDFLNNPQKQGQIKEKAINLIAQHQGATQKIMQCLEKRLLI